MAALDQLCGQAVVELGLVGACVTVLTDAGAELVAASDEATRQLEERQFVLGEGPTPEAFGSAQPVLVADLSSSGSRWLQFAATAAQRGVGGVFAFPLQLGGVRLGVCTFYAAAGMTTGTRRLAELLTWVDAFRELLLDSVDGSGAPLVGLAGSLPLRTHVYQAQGMLMVALGVSLAEALLRLRAMAYAEDVDINLLASELVSGQRSMPGRGVAE